MVDQEVALLEIIVLLVDQEIHLQLVHLKVKMEDQLQLHLVMMVILQEVVEQKI